MTTNPKPPTPPTAPAGISSPVQKLPRIRAPTLEYLLALPLIAAAGVCCIIIPVLNKPRMPAPLFPLLRTGVEKLTWVPIANLAALGLLAGLATRLPLWAIALASISIFPLAAFAEIAKDGTSHNMIPFELVMYALLGLPVLALAAIGRGARRIGKVRN